MSHTKLYHRWIDIKRRCLDNRRAMYKYYGAKGITICDEWKNDFMIFYTWSIDNGYKENLQIDRIDNNKGYSPDNCRWVTSSENCQNREHLKYSNKSGYRGVSKSNKHSWRAMITWKRKLYDIGTFKSKEEAALAYNKFVIENNTFHSLNIIHT